MQAAGPTLNHHRAQSETAEMRAIIIGERESVAAELRQILSAAEGGYEPIEIAPLASAAKAVSAAKYALTVLVVPEQPEAALSVLLELRAATASSIFVVGPTNDARFVLRVLRQGADEYLDQSDLKAELEAG